MKKIALINDLSGLGKCSLTAAIPVISVMGIQACPLPTAVLSAQTGFPGYIYDDYTEKMDQFTAHWKQIGMEFDGIYSGFLGNAAQIRKVQNFLDQFQTKDNLYLADTIMGDHGKAFGMYKEEFLREMQELAKRADVLTPNLTELCLLAEADYESLTAHRQEQDYIERIEEVCQNLIWKAKRAQTVVVTGIMTSGEEKEYIGNLAVSSREKCYVESPYTGVSFSGTGDLFASVLCGSLVNGEPMRETIERAVFFLQDAIEEATQEKIPRDHGVNFEPYLSRLT